MKVVSAQEMLRIEKDAYRDGCSEELFMEDAGKGVAEVIKNFLQKEKSVLLLCGKGNNGGDAYVAGRYLIEMGFKVIAIQIEPPSSKLCQKNQSKFKGKIINLSQVEDIPFKEANVIVDGIFGTGFRGPLHEPYTTVIRIANQSKIPIISIDIPSGIDGNTGITNGETIQAYQTIFLGLPKTGYFLLDAWNQVGKIQGVNFGLKQNYIDEAVADLFLLTKENVKPLLPPIVRNRHKYEAGYVVGLAGSPGMPGAALLSSLAALRSGAGIVRLLHPQGMENELVNSPYELIKTAYHSNESKEVIDYLNKSSSIFIGPGLGRFEETRTFLLKVLAEIKKPCVIDADALTLLANENITLPNKTILTPHHGEMQKLLNIQEAANIDLDYLNKCFDYAQKNKVTLILKGAPTFIFHPDEEIMVNITGNPGMATAGSGDVLTGTVGAFLAQGLSARHAAILAVFIHGIAGELAAQAKTSYSMIASDIIKYLPKAFKFIQS